MKRNSAEDMKRNPADEESLQEGLRRLRELGYLRSPAEDFVARRVPENASAWRVALVAGLWLGVGGGILLGGILALSMLIAQPDLLSNPIDFLWLSIDLLVAGAGLGGFAVVLLTWLLVGHRHHGRPTPAWLERGVFFTLSVLPALYLSDLFGRFLFPRLPGALWYLALIAGAFVAAFLGERWGRLLGALVSAAGLWSSAPGPGPAPSRGWSRAFLLLAAICLLLLGPYRGLRPQPRLDQIAVPPTVSSPSPLGLVFVDGVTPQDCAFTMGLLESQPRELEGESLPLHPESFWSSVATGFPPEVHGLESPAAKAPAGVSGSLGEVGDQPLFGLVLHGLLPGVGLGKLRAHDQRELRRPPFWEIATHLDLSCLVINAWATYPAARHVGLGIVSDRCFLRMWDGKDAGNDPLLVQPPRPELLQRAKSALSHRSSYPSLEYGDSLLSKLPMRQLEEFREVWDYAAAADLFHAFLAEDALGANDPTALILQLNGADMVHRAVSQCEGGPARQMALRLEKKYLAFTDQLLEEVLQVPGRKKVLVLSKVETQGGSARRRAWVWPASFASGGGVYRLTPALLRALGISPAHDMQGAFLGGPPSWGLRPDWTPPATRSSQDLERLRSLGYIGSGKRN